MLFGYHALRMFGISGSVLQPEDGLLDKLVASPFALRMMRTCAAASCLVRFSLAACSA